MRASSAHRAELVAAVSDGKLCLSLREVSDILFPDDYPCWFPRPVVLLEIKRGRLLAPIRIRRAVRVRVADLKAYVNRLRTIEERDRFVREFVGVYGPDSGEQDLLTLMLRLREGWDPFAA